MSILNGHDRVGESKRILDSSGRPIETQRKAIGGAGEVVTVFNTVNSYLQSLTNARLPVRMRATDPFANHVWVFASAMMIATVGSQAQFGVFQETEDEVERRAELAKRRNGGKRPVTVCGSGRRRSAMRRHCQLGTFRRVSRQMTRRAAELDLDHPLAVVFRDPNPLQGENQLWQFTDLWLAVRGEVFWVLTDEEGDSIGPGQMPERIWPLGPDCFEPILEHHTHGELIGWWYRPPAWMPNARAAGSVLRIPLPLASVVQFKFPNPTNPLRGMSRIAAAAMGIETDLAIDSHNRALVENQGVPKGLIIDENDNDAREEAEFLQKWHELYGGVENRGRTAMLSGGMKYMPLAMSPQDMEYLERKKWGRDEVLASIGMPRSTLGLTEFINYATQLGQDFNFWDKTIIPLKRTEESAVDGTLFFTEPDNVFAAFDFSEIEALRAGVADKVEIAEKMAGDRLHMPPRVAYNIVGLEVEDYEGIDDALVSAVLAPVSEVLVPFVGEPSDEPVDNPEPGEDDPEGNDPVEDPLDELEEEAAPTSGDMLKTEKRRKARGGRTWRAFVRLEESLEPLVGRGFRSYVTFEKSRVLAQFDSNVVERSRVAKVADVDMAIVLGDQGGMIEALKSRTRPVYTNQLEAIHDFTLDEIGVPVFSIDDPLIMRTLERRERLFTEASTGTLRANLENALVEGLRLGETAAQLRLRLAQVFDISAKSAKIRFIQRTETASFMNNVRREMFGLQGVELTDFTTAQDENVREPHVIFGQSEPRALGFNYLTLVGEESLGVLEHPGDVRAPIHQVANCRCIEIAEA